MQRLYDPRSAHAQYRKKFFCYRNGSAHKEFGPCIASGRSVLLILNASSKPFVQPCLNKGLSPLTRAFDFALVFSLSQFQPLFVSFIVTISFVIYRYFKAISLIRILPLHTTLVQKYTKAYALVFCNRQLMNRRAFLKDIFQLYRERLQLSIYSDAENNTLVFQHIPLCLQRLQVHFSHGSLQKEFGQILPKK